jgi:hypothetical protein
VRNLISGLVLLMLAGVGGVMAYDLLSDDEENPIDPEVQKHMLAEARRLAADPKKIEQPDARWIADQLGDQPTAERLQELIRERLVYNLRKEVEHIKEHHPEFWNYQERHTESITGSNGVDALNEVKEHAEAIRLDPRYSHYFGRYDQRPEIEIVADFMAEAQPVLIAARKALEADVIVDIQPRLESHLDAVDFPATWAVLRVLEQLAFWQAREGMIQEAQDTLTTALKLHSRIQFVGNVLTLIVPTIANDILVQQCVVHFPRLHEVPVERLREWLALGRAVEFDPLRAFANDFADSIRASLNDLERDDEIGSVMSLLDKDESIEGLFAEHARQLAGQRRFIGAASGETPSLRVLEGARQANEHMKQLHFYSTSDKMCFEAYQVWAALELRILEREFGPLAEQQETVETALEAWPGLRAVFAEDGVELWLDHEVLPYAKPDEPLIRLAPLPSE